MQPAVTFIVSTLFALLLAGCGSVMENSGTIDCVCAVSDTTTSPMLQTMRGGLLGTRFESLDALKSVVQIEYEAKVGPSDSVPANYLVRLRHCSSGKAVVSVLETGTTQGDILKAKQGTWGKIDEERQVLKMNKLVAWRHRFGTRLNFTKKYLLLYLQDLYAMRCTETLINQHNLSYL